MHNRPKEGMKRKTADLGWTVAAYYTCPGCRGVDVDERCPIAEMENAVEIIEDLCGNDVFQRAKEGADASNVGR